MTAVRESQEESTHKIVLDIFLNNLGVRLDLSEIDRSHRGKLTRTVMLRVDLQLLNLSVTGQDKKYSK